MVPISKLAEHTEVAGYVYAVIGVIYAVVLALVVIAAWEDYRDARDVVADEASAVLNLARAANGWPAGDRDAVDPPSLPTRDTLSMSNGRRWREVTLARQPIPSW